MLKTIPQVLTIDCSVRPQKGRRHTMKVEIDDLSRPAVHALLNEHLQNMYELSPRESVHALDLEKLRTPEITFWSAWEGPLLLGCGALKELDRKHGEVKSMRTPTALRRKGADCGPFGDYLEDPNSVLMTMRLQA